MNRTKAQSSSLKLPSKSTMAVLTTSPTKTEIKGQQILAKKQPKTFDKTRPITATLDHPLILDIKLLKKLDMTTFTKKGLIALSKFCGISLINKNESKRKLNKCLKTIQYSKKQLGLEGVVPPKGLEPSKKDSFRIKRKPTKHVPKINSRVRFRITDDISCSEEDSSDVVCKRHDRTKTKVELKPMKENNATEKRPVVDDVFIGTTDNIIPEPCKTCSRSEHPERFHSHPKLKLSDKHKSSGKTNLEEQFKNSLTTKDSPVRVTKSPDAKVSEKSPQKTLKLGEKNGKSTSNKLSSSSSSPSKNSLDSESVSETEQRKLKVKKSTASPSPKKSQSEVLHIKKMNSRNSTNSKDLEKSSSTSNDDDSMKFVTGCYICGKPMSPKMRIKHEESCISEWRSQNDALSPEKRKPEPIRPDYRFTASGDLDPEGTFESIWANHKDSLVPCKKCGRKFFPDRIERHENCCNNQPVTFKYKHV